MAKQFSGIDVPMKAHDDLSAAQWLFVKMGANETADACDGATDVVMGVLQDEGSTGQGLTVRVLGHTKVYLGGVVAAGDLVGTHTDAKAVKITAGTSTTAYVAGRCVVGGNTGEVGEIVLIPGGRAA